MRPRLTHLITFFSRVSRSLSAWMQVSNTDFTPDTQGKSSKFSPHAQKVSLNRCKGGFYPVCIVLRGVLTPFAISGRVCGQYLSDALLRCSVHEDAKAAQKHERVALSASNHTTLCDICQEQTAALFCSEDRALMCRRYLPSCGYHCDVFKEPFTSVQTTPVNVSGTRGRVHAGQV